MHTDGLMAMIPESIRLYQYQNDLYLCLWYNFYSLNVMSLRALKQKRYIMIIILCIQFNICI